MVITCPSDADKRRTHAADAAPEKGQPGAEGDPTQALRPKQLGFELTHLATEKMDFRSLESGETICHSSRFPAGALAAGGARGAQGNRIFADAAAAITMRTIGRLR